MSAPIPDDETAIKYFRRNRSRYIAETTIDAYERGAREWLEYLANPGKKSYDPDAFDREPQRFYEAGVGDLRYFFQYLVNRSDLATGTIKLRKSGISTFYQAMRELSEDENRQIDLPSTDNPVEEVDLRDWKDFDGNTKKQTESTSERRISYLKPEEIKTLADSVPSPKLRNQLIVELMLPC
jgi:integrase